MATSFSGEGSRREPLTTCKQLVNFITCGYESTAPFLAHLAKGNVSFCHHLASIMDRDEMSNLYRGPAIDASYQVLLHLAERGFRGED
jgi:hypothetical protein